MKNYIFLILPAVLWGLQPIAIKILLQQYTSATILLIRTIVMVLVYFILIRKSCTNWLPKATMKQWVLLGCMGVCGTTICGITQYEGLQYAPVFHCLLFSATAPAITACMAVIFLKEILSVFQWMGIGMSILGIFYMLTNGQIMMIFTEGISIGDLLFFLFELSWSIYIIIGRYVMRIMSPLQATTWAGLIGLLTFIPYLIFSHDFQCLVITEEALFLFIFISVFSGAISMVAWNKGIALIGANGAIFNNLTPFMGMVFGYLILGEVINFSDIIGFFMVIIGIFMLVH